MILISTLKAKSTYPSVKMEMHKRGLKKKEAKKLGNYNIRWIERKKCQAPSKIGKRPTLNFIYFL